MKSELIIIHAYFWPKLCGYLYLAYFHIRNIEHRTWFDSLEFFAMIPLYILCALFIFGFSIKRTLIPKIWLILVAANAAFHQFLYYEDLYDLLRNLALFWPIYVITFVYLFINKGKGANV